MIPALLWILALVIYERRTGTLKRALNRRLYCSRDQHRDVLYTQISVMSFRCLDCRRWELLGTAHHASNHRVARRRRRL